MAKKKENGKPKPAKKPNGKLPDWKCHLGSYRELSALAFASDADIEAAIALLWTEELRTMPHDLADGMTIIVPKESVPWFVRAGLKFKIQKVGRQSDLSPEERAQLRREQGTY
jgi:hypothetical protein